MTYASDGDYVALQAVECVQFWDWSDIHNSVILSYFKLDGIEPSDYGRGAWWLFWQVPYVYVGGGPRMAFTSSMRKTRVPPDLLSGYLPMRPVGFGFITMPFESPGIHIMQFESLISDNWEVVYHVTDSGILNIALAGTTPITSGTLLALHAQRRLDAVDLQGEQRLDGERLNRLSIRPATDFHGLFALRQNSPNPFNASTLIQYLIPEATEVSIDLYNILGQHVSTLLRRPKAAGSYTLRVSTGGVYFYRLQAGSFTQVKKMVLIK